MSPRGQFSSEIHSWTNRSLQVHHDVANKREIHLPQPPRSLETKLFSFYNSFDELQKAKALLLGFVSETDTRASIRLV
jgi:hypothetical protein